MEERAVEIIKEEKPEVLDAKKKISSTFNVARFFALISIVCAHISFAENTSSVITRIFSVVASIGVVCFMIISGYYYDTEKFSGFFGMLKKKAISIGLPWLFFGVISYLYNTILSGSGISVLKLFNWVIGNGTYLYYLTVLFLCFLIFYKTNLYVLIGAMLVSIVSLMLTASGVWQPVIDFLHITNYLNIFNWVGVFALGMFMKKHLSAEKLYSFLVKIRWFALAAFNIVAVLLVIFKGVKLGYFSYLGIWLELLGALAILSISTLKILDVKFVRDISSLSFAIYLVHMMAIGVLDKIYNMHIVLQTLSSAIVIFVCYLLLVVARWFVKLLKIEKYLYPVLGFRKRK